MLMFLEMALNTFSPLNQNAAGKIVHVRGLRGFANFCVSRSPV